MLLHIILWICQSVGCVVRIRCFTFSYLFFRLPPTATRRLALYLLRPKKKTTANTCHAELKTKCSPLTAWKTDGSSKYIVSNTPETIFLSIIHFNSFLTDLDEHLLSMRQISLVFICNGSVNKSSSLYSNLIM